MPVYFKKVWLKKEFLFFKRDWILKNSILTKKSQTLILPENNKTKQADAGFYPILFPPHKFCHATR